MSDQQKYTYSYGTDTFELRSSISVLLDGTALNFELPSGIESLREELYETKSNTEDTRLYSDLYWTFEVLSLSGSSQSLSNLGISVYLVTTLAESETRQPVQLPVGQEVRFLEPEDGVFTRLEFELHETPSCNFVLKVGAELVGVWNNTNLGAQFIRYVVPEASQPASMPVDEAAGPKYRKIALNGRPISDDKPQSEAESDEEPEETYIDALSLSLRHSVTDIYVPVPASDLALSVRRNAAPEIWSLKNGLRPHERLDLPFGVGWSTNLTPTIKLTLGDYTGVSSTPTDPDMATVYDENGEAFSYAIKYKAGVYQNGISPVTSPTTANIDGFIARPNGRHNQQAYLNDLAISDDGTTFTLSKRFGTTVTYELVAGASHVISANRMNGSEVSQKIYYARATKVTDKYENSLIYKYAGSSLIPHLVAYDSDNDSDADDESLRILVGYSNGRIDQVVDPNDNIISYGYANGAISIEAPHLTAGEQALLDNGFNFGTSYPTLSTVTHADSSETNYGYYYTKELDEYSELIDIENNKFHHHHVYLNSITDANDNEYRFVYDQMGSYYDWHQALWLQVLELDGDEHTGYYKPSGRPFKVSGVDLPAVGAEGTVDVSFNDNSVIALGQGAVLSGCLRETVVEDAEGSTITYNWPIEGYTDVEELPDVRNSYGTDEEDFSTPMMVYFKRMQITYAMGAGNEDLTETFDFNPDAGMAVAQASDVNSNLTSFAYNDVLTGGYYASRYPEPTSQQNAHADTKSFTYTDTALSGRVMDSITDEAGRYTHYTLDSIGRRTHERIYKSQGGQLLSHTEFTYDTSLKGFMRQRIVHSHASDALLPADPTWSNGAVPDKMVTLYEPYTSGVDKGRVKRQAVDMDKSGTISDGDLITSYTYDANGNRRSITDPNNYTTWFFYDERNRLKQTIYPDDTSRQTVYDPRGNVVLEINENGKLVGHEYDQLNRRIRTIVDMDGDLVFDSAHEDHFTGDSAPDLITTFAYNDVNSLTVTVDPRGYGTRNQYDNLQRLRKTIAPVADAQLDAQTGIYVPVVDSATDYTTQFEYETSKNSGSGLFSSTAFKPTLITDPRGYETRNEYDELYRLERSKVQYEIGAIEPEHKFATTSYEYDAVGNQTAVVDPLSKRSETVYDGLNRPIATLLAVGTSDESVSLSAYTSTGLAYQTIQLVNGSYHAATQLYTAGTLDRKTDTEYDRAGRAVLQLQPQVYDAVAQTNDRPETRTGYDANGNVVQSINPRGYTWDTYYDSRNRPYITLEPGTYDASINEWGRARVDTFYDAVGNVTSITDARGYSTYTTYDAANRPRLVMSPEVTFANGTTGYPALRNTYDAAGNVLTIEHGTVADPAVAEPVFTSARTSTTNTYDALGRLKTTMDAETIVVHNEYDEVGNRIAVIDGKNQRTEFTYDGLSRNTATLNGVFGAGANEYADATVFVFDAVNQTDRYRGVTPSAAGQHTSYDYDHRHRLKTVDYGADLVIDRAYHYDVLGNILVVDEAGTQSDVAYVYDALNRIRAEHSAGVWHLYEYDLAGNRDASFYAVTDAALTTPELLIASPVSESTLSRSGAVSAHRSIQTTYDSVNRTATMTEGDRQGQYRYDFSGSIIEKWQANGDRVIQAYDALGRVETIRGPGLIGDELYVTQNAYDLYGNLAKITETYPQGKLTDRIVENSYDGANRLHTETITSGAHVVITTYAYDAAHNRTLRQMDADGSGSFSTGDIHTRTVFTNALNQPAYSYTDSNNSGSWESGEARVDYLHDDRGNRQSAAEDTNGDGVSDRTVNYVYDYENRLEQLSNATGTYSYAYDYRTRRVVRDESAAGGSRTVVSFSGGTSVREYANGAVRPNVEYIRGSDYGGGIGGILYTVRPDYIHLESLPLSAYSTGQDGQYGISTNATFAGDGYELQIGSNSWKKFDFSYTVTPNTMLTFEFFSDDDGEALAIGFDNDNSYLTAPPASLLKLSGDQTGLNPSRFNQTYDNYEVGSGWKAYAIPLGDHMSGPMTELVFVCDEDRTSHTASARYRNIQIFEGTAQELVSFKHYNARGDVVAATDASGALTYQAAYEAFGQHGSTDSSADWGSTLDRQQANTKDEDPTGLLNEGFRYRDLESGTFITRDPLGFVDGPNVYTYVVQNPWTFFDPLGLNKFDSAKMAALRAKAQDPNNSAMTRLGAAFQALGTGLNPFNSESNLRVGMRQFNQNAEVARGKLKEAPPVIREVSQFTMGVGMAGTAPLSVPAGVGELTDAVQQKGITQTAKDVATGLVDHALSNPVEFAGEMVVAGAATKPLKATPKQTGTTTVTSWADEGITPVLNSGKWVMKGEATLWNFWKSGLPGPKATWTSKFPFIKFEKSKADFSNSITDKVPNSSLKTPPGAEAWKASLGQRVLKETAEEAE